MTSREARTLRRAEERKAKKLEEKLIRSTVEPLAAHFNPELEDEFPRELQMGANAVRDRIHRKAGLAPLPGFVSQTASEPSKRAEINRQNAQHSTGPRSVTGKVASSGNSLKHGLASGTVVTPGEDPAAFEALLRDLLDEHHPANPTEELLVNEIAQSYWLTQRAIRLQNECFNENGVDEKRLSLFLRYQTTHDRAFHKALTTLLRLKKCGVEACLAAPSLASFRNLRSTPRAVSTSNTSSFGKTARTRAPRPPNPHPRTLNSDKLADSQNERTRSAQGQTFLCPKPFFGAWT